jgi:hypothetical protein
LYVRRFTFKDNARAALYQLKTAVSHTMASKTRNQKLELQATEAKQQLDALTKELNAVNKNLTDYNDKRRAEIESDRREDTRINQQRESEAQRRLAEDIFLREKRIGEDLQYRLRTKPTIEMKEVSSSLVYSPLHGC